MEDIEEAWNHFCDGDYNFQDTQIQSVAEVHAPKCSELYISTKTKISYLNMPINLYDTFWKIPVILYHLPKEGIIKKQMKFNSLSCSELTDLQQKISDEKEYSKNHIDEYIIQQVDVQSNRNSFKDVRKISIGLSKKDITSYKCKKKSAFYNCFVVILRLKCNNTFKEHSVKVFNTGKLQIPGIQNDETLNKILDLLISILNPICITSAPITYLEEKHQTVLINSNFNCGYYINREKLYHILKYDYNINSAYDPCSYPGIQCEFFYILNSDLPQNGKQPNGTSNVDVVKVSFMIFRTGSVLIVGKCSEYILKTIYEYIKNLLESEFHKIFSESHNSTEHDDLMESKRKVRKKTIIMDKSV
jgi:TATA-box binding protein (TBP) (component of TFIID and TFIIIB)